MKKQDNRVYEFADFRLEMGERALLRGGQTVPLRPKIFELLVFLIEHRGEILEKDEITSAVWGSIRQGSSDKPAANLTVSISELRQVLKDDTDKPIFIATITGRGYRFIPLVRMVEPQQTKPAEVLLSVASAASGGSHSAFLPAAESLAANVAPAASARPNDNSPDSGREAQVDGVLTTNQPDNGVANELKIAGLRKPALVVASAGLMLIAILLVWGAAKFRLPQTNESAGRSGGNSLRSSFAPLQTKDDTAVLPQIDSIQPAAPLAWIGDKSIRVSGSGFRPGLSVTMVFPGGGSTSLSGTQVLNVTLEGFTLIADFNNNPGQYRIRVDSPEGLHSDWLTFDVLPISLLPEIVEVKPGGIVNGMQRVTANGHNFLQSVSAVLIYPDGQIEYLQAMRITASSFYLLFDPRGQSGPFKLQAQNSGKGSNLVSFSISKR
ncbi:MAG: transcriptional regulator [Acidobacteriota bacterium]